MLMQDKKGKQGVDSRSHGEMGSVQIIIKDGYHVGDRLNIGYSDIVCEWREDSQSLVIENTSSDRIVRLLDTLNLETQRDSGGDRYIEVQFRGEDGEVLVLDEYNISDSRGGDKGVTFEYKEEEGGDFLSSSVEESLPYHLISKDDMEIYRILRDSFSDGKDSLEIEGYDIATDKVDLEEFSREFGEALNYKISMDKDNVNLSIYGDGNEYNIILKDVMSEGEDKLEEMLQTLIIDTTKV